ADVPVSSREQVEELERAGVDAVIVGARHVADLAGDVRRPSNAGDHRSATRWGGPGAALAAILVGAATIRLVGIQYGLPFGNLLNPDEDSIVPRAWKLVHGGGGDPHWFNYPTLLMYVNAPFQAWQSQPSFLTARIIEVVLSLGAIAAAWWLGRRSYGSGVVPAAVVAVCT